jgi:hypothetical protein
LGCLYSSSLAQWREILRGRTVLPAAQPATAAVIYFFADVPYPVLTTTAGAGASIGAGAGSTAADGSGGSNLAENAA